MSEQAALRAFIAHSRTLVDPRAQCHVMAPPPPPLARDEAFCTEVLRAPGAMVVFHTRSRDEGAGLWRCVDCGQTTTSFAKA